MGKDGFQVVRNEVGALPSNSIYGIYLHFKRPVGKALQEWLRSLDGQQALRATARHYSDGLHKLGPKALLRVRIPTAVLGTDEAEVNRSEVAAG